MTQAQPLNVAATVVVTRDEGPAGPLSHRLSAAGHQVLNWPVIGTFALADQDLLKNALCRLDDYNWLVITSPRTIEAMAGYRETLDRLPSLAVIGQEIERRLKGLGISISPELEAETAADLAAQLVSIVDSSHHVLFLAGSLAPDTVPQALRAAGVTVTRVDAYGTEFQALDLEICQPWIDRDEIDVLTFASSSAVSGLQRGLGPALFERVMKACRIVAIGPTTAEAVSDRGYIPSIASQSSLAALADAVTVAVQSERVM